MVFFCMLTNSKTTLCNIRWFCLTICSAHVFQDGRIACHTDTTPLAKPCLKNRHLTAICLSGSLLENFTQLYQREMPVALLKVLHHDVFTNHWPWCCAMWWCFPASGWRGHRWLAVDVCQLETLFAQKHFYNLLQTTSHLTCLLKFTGRFCHPYHDAFSW